MKLKHKLILAYIAIGLLYACYAHFFGSNPSKPWGWHIGQGLVWPAVLIPGLGSLIGGVIIIAFVIAITVL
ncbi:MAG: hypothetical protein HY836_09815 [Aquabacterium sp.]|uniref:hypothetical protein n=1 Tax=Aquabacterium sp. TaxID=1872578 RepID=UPI0025C2CE92|nr:hypothetical protein [Aquabacterium sp.]MBI5925881.1 hypothetical protein [Aquabacterium sp.]